MGAGGAALEGEGGLEARRGIDGGSTPKGGEVRMVVMRALRVIARREGVVEGGVGGELAAAISWGKKGEDP